MYFALEGAKGIEYIAGNEMVKNFVGRIGYAIIFNDSFEHSIYNGGDRDLFIDLAVLAHQEV